MAKNTADIGFEKQIWDAACVLRGNMDASEYKNVVLGLIFLKYISDRFDDKYQELKDEGDGFEEDIDEYTSEGIFFVPVGARWNEIAAKAHTPEIGTVIDDAMRAIEKENKRLKDILPKNFARPELDKRRLGDVVDLFTNIQMIEHGSEKDILGRTYEYCLSMFAEQEGKRGGEFFTPSCVVRTLVEVLKPYKGRVYDPCCGSGGMFVQSAKFVENHSGNISNISIYGQDSNPTTWKMAQMNLAIRGIEPDLSTYAADTFLDDRHPTLRADYIMANPPFNLSDWGADKLKEDVRWQYGMPPAGNANFAWLQHMIYHLAPAGRIGMVLANGSLSSQSGGEGEIRKNIINADLVECIVAMPTQLFYTTQIPVSLWFINKQKKQTGKTLFIDARKMGTMVSRKLRELTDDDIKKISDTYESFADGMLEDVKGFCAVADIAEIEKQDYILTPGRYVGIEEQEDDGEPFEEKMDRLTWSFRKCLLRAMNSKMKFVGNWGRLGMKFNIWEDCPKVPITELLSFIVDNRGKTVPTANDGWKLIATNCVTNNTLFPVYEKVRYLTQETYETWFRAHPMPGDILFVNKGTPGRVCMVPDPVDFCIAQDMIALRADDKKIYNKYLFAVLRSREIQQQIYNTNVGDVIPHFKKQFMDQLLIPVPDRKIQEKIGNLYYQLSYKVELNKKINENLAA